MGSMGPMSAVVDEADWDGTVAAIVLAEVDDGPGKGQLTKLLRSLARRGTTVVVLDRSLGESMREPRLPSHGERFLLPSDDGRSLVEVTGNGVRRLWSGEQGQPGPALDRVLELLAHEGIYPGHTALVGDGGGEQGLAMRLDPTDDISGFLESQIGRIDNLRLPFLGLDPGWALSFDDEHLSIRVRETLCALANGHLGARGSAEEEPPGSDPLLVASGVYDDQSPPALLEGPRWTSLPLNISPAERERWVLDMRGGLVARIREMAGGTLRTVRFVSAVRPGCAVLSADGPVHVFARDEVGSDGLTDGARRLPAASVKSTRGTISASASERLLVSGRTASTERILAYETATSRQLDTEKTGVLVRDLAELGSRRLLFEHRAEWGRRWRGAEVSIDGDPETEKAVRFALFHLLSSASTAGESAVGARGLTGRAYRGHVFWDTDVFVLPVLCAVLPEAARSILEYRVARLPQARAEARQRGFRGARFPWESADDGSDVTPRSYTGPDGEVVPIRTGLNEEHIVADVAWAARHYSTWTGDWEYLVRGPGRTLIDETARYWASRIRVDPAQGRGHIGGVIGPDEYHEMVDDNAFTNVMARANLSWASAISRLHGTSDPGEVEAWSDLAARIVDGYDPGTGVYEQFAGYDDLKPLTIEEVGGAPMAADLMLGREVVAASQLIKQADVLMLHHMVPEEVAPGSLGPNLDRYLPRTAHGSSLSPAIHASLLARAGRVDEALWWFRLASRLDLDDLTGTTAGGIHLATMGGLWQALAFGFIGLEVGEEGIRVDPRLPDGWSALTMSLTALGSLLKVRVTPEEVHFESDRPVSVTCGGASVASSSDRIRFTRSSGSWKEAR
jgi:trehalose/maltose hydrolase-like predicted phosphorylase